MAIYQSSPSSGDPLLPLKDSTKPTSHSFGDDLHISLSPSPTPDSTSDDILSPDSSQVVLYSLSNGGGTTNNPPLAYFSPLRIFGNDDSTTSKIFPISSLRSANVPIQKPKKLSEKGQYEGS